MTVTGTGKLILVATPIGNLGDLSPRAVEALAGADVIACEDTRHSRKLLHHAGITSRRLLAVHAHNEQEQAARLVQEMANGAVVAFVTDAGTPGISDPGERLVAAVVEANIDVEVVPGPAAVIAALVVSGLPTARFCFEGFLPRKGKDRTQRLGEIAGERRTTVVYEAPHRLTSTVDDLAQACGGDRRIAIARELTKKFEEVWRGTLNEAAARVKETDAKGEYVLVIEGAPLPPPPTEEDIEAALRARQTTGLSTRDVVTQVAIDLGVGRRMVYEVAKRLDNSA
ncbi:MAG: rRNA (cytidine1402-2-O)-methyltransferase [Actinomycetota bacterium]|nr:rRNA (cytidine1402-2-O)-methyltransferase [Actinomycetota bacterium]